MMKKILSLWLALAFSGFAQNATVSVDKNTLVYKGPKTLAEFMAANGFGTANFPNQSGHAGEFLKTDGAFVSWSAFSLGPNSVTSSMIVDGTIVNADIAPGAAIANTKIAGLAASATTDTTNASNIVSGTLGDARLTGNVALFGSTQTLPNSSTIWDIHDGRTVTIKSSTGTGTLQVIDGGRIGIGANGALEIGSTASIASDGASLPTHSLWGTGAAGKFVTITAGTDGQALFGNTGAPAAFRAPTATDVGLGNVPNVDATNASNLSSGTLPAARMPALTGNVTSSVGGVSTTIQPGVVTNAMLAGGITNSKTTATDANTASAIVARDASGNFTAGTITASLSGNATTASTATTVTARLINGVSYNASADITITASAATLTGSTLPAGVTGSSLTSLGSLSGLTVASNGATLLQGATTLTPTARTGSTAAYLTINYPADSSITNSTEAIGIKGVTASRAWSGSGTVGRQREIYFPGPIYVSGSATQTFTDAFTLYIDNPVAGTNVLFTRPHSVGVKDATTASSPITGGLLVTASDPPVSATSVGIGGGNINAGGTITAPSFVGALTGAASSLSPGATINGVNYTGNSAIVTNGLQIYGAGNDGALAAGYAGGINGGGAAGQLVLTRDMYWSSMVGGAGDSIVTNGYLIFCSGTCDLANAPAGLIQFNGNAGGNASVTGAGAAGAALAGATIGGGNTGLIGKAGGTTTGTAGTSGTGPTSSGGRGGASGAGGAGGVDVAATGNINDGGLTNVTAGDTVTINGKVYTWVSPIGVTEGNVLRDPATPTNSLDNLVSAIMHTGGTAGVNYVTAATNPDVTASRSTGQINFTAIVLGTAGNSITLARSNSSLFTISGAFLSGGVSNPQAGGALAASTAPTNVLPILHITSSFLRGSTLIAGGCAGSSGGSGAGDGTAGGGSGGSGTGAGKIGLFAAVINRDGTTAVGAIQAIGGNGGNGGVPAGGNRGGGGGGGAGGGGDVYIVAGSLTGSTATNCIDVSGGTGGNGGNAVGTTAIGGGGGDGGYGGRITVTVSPASVTHTDQTATSGTSGSTTSNGTGATGGAGRVTRGSL